MKALLIIVRLLYALVSAGAIATYISPGAELTPGVRQPHPVPFVDQHPALTFAILFGITQAVTVVDLFIRRKRIEVISALYFGILIGALLSYLMILAIEPVFRTFNRTEYQEGVGTVLTLVVIYLSTSFLLQTKDDFRFVIPYVEFARELKGGKPLILDSSALIDGRIADVIETKILDNQILVPAFVLREVQDIADSNDKNRRIRGRRGLDVLSKLQKSPNADVVVYETDSKQAKREAIDQMLIELAKQLGGRVITNDFNLNKVASVQGVDAINLNDVANSLKPRFLPGESLRIKIIKEGESAGQGVGYLDDGTMVVCELAANMIGRDVSAVVTSVLQSSAGRMIFVRMSS